MKTTPGPQGGSLSCFGFFVLFFGGIGFFLSVFAAKTVCAESQPRRFSRSTKDKGEVPCRLLFFWGWDVEQVVLFGVFCLVVSFRSLFGGFVWWFRF